MRRRCWFCRYRAKFALVAWHGKWRRACPACQVLFERGELKDPK